MSIKPLFFKWEKRGFYIHIAGFLLFSDKNYEINGKYLYSFLQKLKLWLPDLL